jgi:hypothetical protein
MLRSGVPASVTLAQGILESQAGQSDLVRSSNNHFGIKCKGEWTGEKVYHDDDATGECFRKYTNAEDSYRDHSDFLKTRAHYAFLFKLDPTDYEGWCKGLKKAGYATNPAYPQLLMKTIVENNLQAYTMTALNRMKGNGDDMAVAETKKEATETITNIQNTNAADSVAKPQIKVVNAVYTQPEVKTETPKSKFKEADNYPVGVFTINQTKVVFATAGTSLLALAQMHNVALDKLFEFNDFEKQQEILENNQLIYLQKKNKKGTSDVHVVGINETLYQIAQREGIRLQSLLELNRIPKGMEPAAGEKIYLKVNSPVTPKLVSSNGK